MCEARAVAKVEAQRSHTPFPDPVIIRFANAVLLLYDTDSTSSFDSSVSHSLSIQLVITSWCCARESKDGSTQIIAAAAHSLSSRTVIHAQVALRMC